MADDTKKTTHEDEDVEIGADESSDALEDLPPDEGDAVISDASPEAVEEAQNEDLAQPVGEIVEGSAPNSQEDPLVHETSETSSEAEGVKGEGTHIDGDDVVADNVPDPEPTLIPAPRDENLEHEDDLDASSDALEESSDGLDASSSGDMVVAVYDEEGDLEEDSDVSSDDIALGVDGYAAYFDYPGELLEAAVHMRDADFDAWDAYSPFPIHGIEDAMGIGRSWLPWVTFAAGGTGFLLANLLQFGMLTFDWPMIIGGKPYAPWPSFVPIMFELTVLIGGVTTALVMFIAAGCFRKPRIIDPEITNDRFVIWVDAKDPRFDEARLFLEGLDPVEIRTVTFEK